MAWSQSALAVIGRTRQAPHIHLCARGTASLPGSHDPVAYLCEQQSFVGFKACSRFGLLRGMVVGPRSCSCLVFEPRPGCAARRHSAGWSPVPMSNWLHCPQPSLCSFSSSTSTNRAARTARWPQARPPRHPQPCPRLFQRHRADPVREAKCWSRYLCSSLRYRWGAQR
jgi:hypothetical protein